MARFFAAISVVVGLALIVGLVALNGYREILGGIVAAGWGILAVVAAHAPQMVFSSQAWRWMVLPPSVPGSIAFFWLRLVREAVNALLPVAQIGGELVAARLMGFGGVSLSKAGASVTLDLTLEMVSQIAFTLLGLGLLLSRAYDAEVVHWSIIGMAIATLATLGFIGVQRFGAFHWLERGLLRLARRPGWESLGDAAGLHEAIVTLYKSPRRLWYSGLNHFVSWVLGGVEVMAAFWVLGVDVSFRDCLIIESLSQAARAVGFAVPGALGIQEGGTILICGLLGISPQTALELSLLKRIRELLLGVPGLIAWQIAEQRQRAIRLALETREKTTAGGTFE